MTSQAASTITHVPLLDLQAQYAPIEADIRAAFETVLSEKQFIMGPQIEALEKEAAIYCQTKYTLGVSSGTDALVLALMAMNIGAGDEVITSPFTFFATAGSISRVGAKPVFVDIDPETFNIDTSKIEAAITPNTKAIMPVHLFGQMADMDSIMAIAKAHNLYVIEDSAQSLGAEYKSKDGKTYRAGSMGDVGCFSFFPSKNLGCLGDGGLVSTNDPELYDKMNIMRVHGSKPKYYHHVVGGNFRLDTLQAAFLLVKLPLLEQQHRERIENAAFYNQALADVADITLPAVKTPGRMIYNQYTLIAKDRDALHQALNDAKVGNAIYYPVPLHLQECFSDFGHKVGDFPISEQRVADVLSIPIYSELSQEQMGYVVDTIRKFYNA
jgi:dTDP-4-amino-4,6-dideoxygalactose transaminase